MNLQDVRSKINYVENLLHDKEGDREELESEIFDLNNELEELTELEQELELKEDE